VQEQAPRAATLALAPILAEIETKSEHLPEADVVFVFEIVAHRPIQVAGRLSDPPNPLISVLHRH